jgi:hypothetical protein
MLCLRETTSIQLETTGMTVHRRQRVNESMRVVSREVSYRRKKWVAPPPLWCYRRPPTRPSVVILTSLTLSITPLRITIYKDYEKY